MEQLNILHFGVGNVGNTIVHLIADNQKKIRDTLSLDLKYCGFFTSGEGYYYTLGFPLEKTREYRNQYFSSTAKEAVEKIPLPFVVLDTTASEDTVPLLMRALQRGGYLVMSNKKPLSSSQAHFNSLHEVPRRRVMYETTVGAGLPVIQTLRNLLWTGDEILEIKGCFSATLDFVCSAIDEGMSFSDAVKKAQLLGHTEPDPREDLSGIDVARKALILCRVMGRAMELEDIKLKTFYPSSLSRDIPLPEFMTKLAESDSHFAKLFNEAKKNNNTLRYIATINKEGVTVELKEVPKDSIFGQLKGPDNLVVFKTKMYNEHPMIIRGPGGGVEVTASGVLADILSICF